jgi:hypothetical protein
MEAGGGVLVHLHQARALQVQFHLHMRGEDAGHLVTRHRLGWDCVCMTCAGIHHHRPSRAPRQHISPGLWVWGRGVYTHIHDLVKGTFYPPPPSLENPKSVNHASIGFGHTTSSQGTLGLGAKHLLGKLP